MVFQNLTVSFKCCVYKDPRPPQIIHPFKIFIEFVTVGITKRPSTFFRFLEKDSIFQEAFNLAAN